MFRLLFLLGGAMLLTMVIGGQDRGQTRLGLRHHYAAPVLPAAPVVQADTVPSEPPPRLVLANLPATAAAPEPVAALPVVPAPVAAEAPAAAPEALPVRYVNANAVNVRQGPSTTDAVIGRLTRNEAVSVVGEAADGWLRVRIEGDGIEGFVAGRLLSERAP